MYAEKRGGRNAETPIALWISEKKRKQQKGYYEKELSLNEPRLPKPSLERGGSRSKKSVFNSGRKIFEKRTIIGHLTGKLRLTQERGVSTKEGKAS